MSYLFHPSSVSQLMAEPASLRGANLPEDVLKIYNKKTKTDEDKAILAPYWRNTLSQGAKTYLGKIAKQVLFGYTPEVTTKEMLKGLRCEQESINLYNSVFFTSHEKNSRRVESDILTGECDLLDDDLIIDIKTPWSLETWPALPEDGDCPEYEWQGRAYMLLYDKPRFELAYCMVTTPPDLIGYEDASIHLVDHIPAEMRITRVQYERDVEKEAHLIAKCKAGQAYIETLIQRIIEAHK